MMRQLSKWKLCSLPEEYIYSSAAFYMLNKEHPFVRITHWKDVGGFNASSA